MKLETEAAHFTPVVPVGAESYGVLSHKEVARALRVNDDTLEKLVRMGDGPPRFRSSPRRWAYPIRDLKAWQEKRIALAEARAKAESK